MTVAKFSPKTLEHEARKEFYARSRPYLIVLRAGDVPDHRDLLLSEHADREEAERNIRDCPPNAQIVERGDFAMELSSRLSKMESPSIRPWGWTQGYAARRGRRVGIQYGHK